MDRLDAMGAFVAVADLGGFSAAARKLGCSAASVTRAVASLEARTGSRLLLRTTRTVKLTEAGERYLESCRRILTALDGAERDAARGRAVPHGTLTVTAPVEFGRRHVRPLVDRWLGAHAEVRARLLLVDRVVNLVDEGVDLAVRIAHLPDSSLVAVRVGEVRRVVCASPSYLAAHPRPRDPQDLASHDCIALSPLAPGDHWTFRGAGGRRRQARVSARLTVNAADAAVGSALEGHGVACVLSYQVDAELRDGRLVELLKPFALPPLPVHVVYPAESAESARVRAFVEMAVPTLRAALAHRPGPRRAAGPRAR